MILTTGYLQASARSSNMSNKYEQRIVENVNKSLYLETNRYDIFMSHSYLDKILIYQLIKLFNGAGYSVYVDWINDPELDREHVTELTAQLLRKRMKCCKGLSYIATSNIADSKWCPWELGYFDGFSGEKCCILPVLERLQPIFFGQEYLGLYPYIEYDIHNSNKKWDFWVYKSNGEYVSLSEWLEKKDVVWQNSVAKY